jgi:hypothetical protein
MRPAYLRPESAGMRAARQADLAAHQLRAVDLLALALGYGLLLSMCVGGCIALIDAIQGNPQTVLPQIAALIARLD